MMLIKQEVIDSIADQLKMNGAEAYTQYLMREMKNENPYLLKSI